MEIARTDRSIILFAIRCALALNTTKQTGGRSLSAGTWLQKPWISRAAGKHCLLSKSNAHDSHCLVNRRPRESQRCFSPGLASHKSLSLYSVKAEIICFSRAWWKLNAFWDICLYEIIGLFHYTRCRIMCDSKARGCIADAEVDRSSFQLYPERLIRLQEEGVKDSFSARLANEQKYFIGNLQASTNGNFVIVPAVLRLK